MEARNSVSPKNLQFLKFKKLNWCFTVIVKTFFHTFIAGGRLQEEMEYTKKHIGSNGFGIEEFDYESFIQIQKSGKDNMLDNEILLEHLDMLKKVLNLEITMYMQ